MSTAVGPLPRSGRPREAQLGVGGIFGVPQRRAVRAAIAQREPPPQVRAPTSVEYLDQWSRELAAHPPVDDPWAARGVVDILRTRALIAEIRISLVGLRNAVDGAPGAPEGERIEAE